LPFYRLVVCGISETAGWKVPTFHGTSLDYNEQSLHLTEACASSWRIVMVGYISLFGVCGSEI
jgi:hypothetical protein